MYTTDDVKFPVVLLFLNWLSSLSAQRGSEQMNDFEEERRGKDCKNDPFLFLLKGPSTSNLIVGFM